MQKGSITIRTVADNGDDRQTALPDPLETKPSDLTSIEKAPNGTSKFQNKLSSSAQESFRNKKGKKKVSALITMWERNDWSGWKGKEK